MDELYLEVSVSADGKSAFISDWTFYMQDWRADNYGTYMRYSSDFVAIKGKHLTIYVKGFGNNYGRCKSFAIWYICNRETVSTHRLDFVYSKSNSRKNSRTRVSAD